MDNFINKCVLLFFKVVRVEPTEAKVDSLTQFVKFGIVGVSNTAVSYVINVLVLLALADYGLSWDYVAANIVAFVLSVLWSFYWNNRFVFTVGEGQQRSIGKALLKTYISYSFTGIILNNILSYIWIDVFSISKLIAPLINLIVSVPLNFIINKLWAFKTEESEN